MDHQPEQILYPDLHTPIQGGLEVKSSLFMQPSPEQLCQQNYELLFLRIMEMEQNLEAQIRSVQCRQCSSSQALSRRRMQHPESSNDSQNKRCSWCRKAKDAIVSTLQRAMSLIKLRASHVETVNAAGTEDQGRRIISWIRAQEPKCPPRLSSSREPGLWPRDDQKPAYSQSTGPGEMQVPYELPGALDISSYCYVQNLTAELEQQYSPVELASHTTRQSLKVLTRPSTIIMNNCLAASPQSSGIIPSPSFRTSITNEPLVAESFTMSPIDDVTAVTTPDKQIMPGPRQFRCGTGDSWASSTPTLVEHGEPKSGYSQNSFPSNQLLGKHDAMGVTSKDTSSFHGVEYRHIPSHSIDPAPHSSLPFSPDDFLKHSASISQFPPTNSRLTWVAPPYPPQDDYSLECGIVQDDTVAVPNTHFSLQLSPDHGQITGDSGKDWFHETRLQMTSVSISNPCAGESLTPPSDRNLRQGSWDSTSTVTGPRVPDHQTQFATKQNLTDVDISSLKQSPLRRVSGRPTKKKQPRTPRKTTKPPFPTECLDCGFRPARGPDQRKKMERHFKTAKHRENVGEQQKNLEEFLCDACRTTYNRRDNFRQHMKRCPHRPLRIEYLGDVEFDNEDAEAKEAIPRTNLAIRGHADNY
ncbi:hypothetical protein QBC43DRAFT_126235 [Cladorrhinum sp. PSN259]|nr:hypothetical protein QBC43DRAFT_126235 [Cladorrhinum sp. PSN259]